MAEIPVTIRIDTPEIKRAVRETLADAFEKGTREEDIDFSGPDWSDKSEEYRAGYKAGVIDYGREIVRLLKVGEK